MKLREIGTVNVNDNELDKFVNLYEERGILYSVADDGKTIRLYDWDCIEDEALFEPYDDMVRILVSMFEEFLPYDLSVYSDNNSRITIDGVDEMLKTILCRFNDEISRRDDNIKKANDKNLELSKENDDLKKKISEYNENGGEPKDDYEEIKDLLYEEFEAYLPYDSFMFYDENSNITIDGISEMLEYIYSEVRVDLDVRNRRIERYEDTISKLSKENEELKKKIPGYNVDKETNIKGTTPNFKTMGMISIGNHLPYSWYK